MDFLKEILGDELFKQFEEAINAFNGKDENKEKQVKIANLSSGEYVGKGKYDSLNATLQSKGSELEAANNLIEELKKNGKADEDLQAKIKDYENEVSKLQGELEEVKVKAAVKVGLLEAHASDVDYLTYKLEAHLKENNESLEMDSNGKIKGWKNKLEDLKTMCPNQFEGDGEGKMKPYGDNGLPKGGKSKTVTKEDFTKMSYEERLKLKKENEELYNSLRK